MPEGQTLLGGLLLSWARDCCSNIHNASSAHGRWCIIAASAEAEDAEKARIAAQERDSAHRAPHLQGAIAAALVIRCNGLIRRIAVLPLTGKARGADHQSLFLPAFLGSSAS